MIIYKVQRSGNVLDEAKKYFVSKEKALQYLNKLIDTDEKLVAKVKLSESDWDYQLKEVKDEYKYIYGNVNTMVDNERQLVLCEHTQMDSKLKRTKLKKISAFIFYLYIDEDEERYEANESYDMEEIEIEE